MSIKAGVLSADVDKQIDLLRVYPEIAEKYYRPAFERLTEMGTGMIRPTIPVASGKAAQKFRGKVSGKGIKLAASIGWSTGKSQPWYINVVNYGSRPHPLAASIRGSKKKQYWFNVSMENGSAYNSASGIHVKIGKSGEWRTIAVHPGFPAREFMQKGAERLQPLINSVMGAANEAVANALVVK